MDKAINMIEIMNGDRAFLEILEAEDKKERDYQADIIASKRKGLEEGKIEVAKNLLQNNVSVEVISLSTGLSIEQINKLK